MKQNIANIIVSGSLAYDRIMDFPGRFADHILSDKMHQINLSFAVPKLTEKFGGTAGNIAYSLSLLGLKPIIVARAGNDFDNYKKWLVSNKLPLLGIKISKYLTTASAYIVTDKADNQIAGFYMGAMLEPLPVIKGLIKANSLAVVAADLPANMINLADYYSQRVIDYIFDPGQQLINFNRTQLRQFIRTAKVFISNDYELSLLLKKSGYNKEQLLKKIPVVATTLGSKGSVIHSEGRVIKIKSVKLRKVVDPTGAGDAYRAGFIAGLVWGFDWRQTGALASTAASFAVEKYGTQEHYYSKKDFNRRLYKNFGFKI